MQILSWFLLEAFGAAVLVALLVWWTWPRPPKNEIPEENQKDDQQR